MENIGKCQRLKPREADVLEEFGKKGHKIWYENGLRKWNHSITSNDGTGPTKEFKAMCEMVKPFARADSDRVAAMQAVQHRTALKDKNGKTQYVDAALADVTARRNGWGHRWQPRGLRVERGVGGMLYRWLGYDRGWEPLGVTCLGTPLAGSGKADKKIIHYDPEGTAWEWKHGRWRMV